MPNRYAGTPEERTALDAYVKLWRAAHAVEVVANRHLAAYGLTTSQFAVIEALYHLGPMSQRLLADKILRSSGNLTMVIDNLERDGLVHRERMATDRRVVNVTLTTQGEALITQLLPDHVQGIAEVFSVLEPEETEQLTAITRKLGLALQGRLDDEAVAVKARTRRATLRSGAHSG